MPKTENHGMQKDMGHLIFLLFFRQVTGNLARKKTIVSLVFMGLFLFDTFFVSNTNFHSFTLSSLFSIVLFYLIWLGVIVICTRVLRQPAPQTLILPAPSLEAFCRQFDISKREREVIHLLLKGKTYQQIAESLFISAKTVKNHLHNIYTKAGVKNKVELFYRLQGEKEINM